jgi:hypothetical protein
MQSVSTKHAIVATFSFLVAGSIARNLPSLVGFMANMSWVWIDLNTVCFDCVFGLANFWHGSQPERSNMPIELHGVKNISAAVLYHCLD